MWYGLKIDGEIRYVRWFNEHPTIFDFQCYISSEKERHHEQ
jgi:hypothetical protein